MFKFIKYLKPKNKSCCSNLMILDKQNGTQKQDECCEDLSNCCTR